MFYVRKLIHTWWCHKDEQKDGNMLSTGDKYGKIKFGEEKPLFPTKVYCILVLFTKYILNLNKYFFHWFPLCKQYSCCLSDYRNWFLSSCYYIRLNVSSRLSFPIINRNDDYLICANLYSIIYDRGDGLTVYDFY